MSIHCFEVVSTIIVSSSHYLSGTIGLTSVIALIKLSMTFCPDFLPASSMPFNLIAASLLASSSAFLLPEACCLEESQQIESMGRDGRQFGRASSFISRSHILILPNPESRIGKEFLNGRVVQKLKRAAIEKDIGPYLTLKLLELFLLLLPIFINLLLSF